MKPIETIAVKSLNLLLTEMADKPSSKPTTEGKQSVDRALHTFERIRWVQTGDTAYPIVELCFMEGVFQNPLIPKNFKQSSVSEWKWCPNFDAIKQGVKLSLYSDAKPGKPLVEHFVPETELPDIPFSRPNTPRPEIEIVVQQTSAIGFLPPLHESLFHESIRPTCGQDDIGMLGAGASKGDGPHGKRPLKAATPKSILKHYAKKALDQQPEVKSFKKAFHKSRKEVDKIHVAPVLDQIGHAAIDVVDDVIQTILPVVKEEKYVTPELVDHLPAPQSTIGLLGAGASKGDGPPKRSKSRKKKARSKKRSTKPRKSTRKSNVGQQITKSDPDHLSYYKSLAAKKTGGRRRFTSGNQEIFVCKTKLTNVTITTSNAQGDLIKALDLNPRRLAQQMRIIGIVEQMWENFTEISGEIHIAPGVPFTSTTTCAHMIERDATDRVPSGAAAIDSALNHYGNDFSLKNGGRLPFNLKGKFWNDDTGTNTGADVRQQVAGQYRLFVDVKPSTTETVSIWCLVRIHFKNRQLDPVDGAVHLGTSLTISQTVASNIKAADPWGLGLTDSPATIAQGDGFASTGIETWFFTDSARGYIGFPSPLEQGTMMQINSHCTATTSGNIVYDNALSFSSSGLAFGSAAGTEQLYFRQFIATTGALTNINVPSGSLIIKVGSDGTISKLAGPATASVYHYTRWTGTFTAPLTATVSVTLSRHYDSSLLTTWLRETPATIEGRVAREYKQAEHKESFDVWGPKRHSALCGVGYDNLIERLKIFEAIFEKPEPKEFKVEVKPERSDSWFLPRGSKTSSMK